MLRDSHVIEDTITVVIWCAVWDIYVQCCGDKNYLQLSLLCIFTCL